MKKVYRKIDVCDLVATVFDDQWDEPLLIESRAGRQWTYGDVLQRAFRFDSWLRAQGVESGEPIQFAPTNGALPLVVYLGTFLSGRIVQVVDPSRGEQDIKEMLQIASGERLLTDDPSLQERADALSLDSFVKDDVAPKNACLDAVRGADPEAPFLTTFTSGTTGAPKGVVHSFGNLVRASVRFGERFGFDSTDMFYHTLPMGYMAGILNVLLLPLVHGSTISIGPRIRVTTAPGFFDLATETGVNVFWLTPTMLRMLSRLCSGPYEGPESAIGCVATEPLPDTLQSQFESEFGIELYETYGLSETLFVTTEYPGHPQNGVGVGPALPDVDSQILDDGEIEVSPSWLFFEYAGRDAPSPKKKNFRTGDIGKVQGEVLVVTGRKKDLIVRNGINISPVRIEEVLIGHESIADAAVFGRSREGVGEAVVGVVEVLDDSVTMKQLQQRVIQRLGSDHRLDELVACSSLPRTADGRVDYEETHALLDGE
jgi:long-chain acyl-CoA synthetase